MADKLTPQQALAVKNRGGNLLVSAAAGSGKTKVLVDRLLSYLLDEEDPAQIDAFLIITYTKAAAAELRAKIAAKLTERIAQDPQNRHLQRQMQRLYLTKISTVHAFCGDLLREFAYQLDIAPDFRVGDENECRQLKETAMESILEQAYETAQEDEDFRAFVDTQGLGRDDRLLPEILLQVYDSARCHLDPEGWLESCIQNAQMQGISDAAQTPWGSYLMEDLQGYLDLQIQAIQGCARDASCAEAMEKPAQVLQSTVAQLQQLRSQQSWDGIFQHKEIDYGRLTFSKKVTDQALIDRIKAIREGCKKGLQKKLRSFASDSAQTLADMGQCASAVRGMVALVKAFSEAYERLKKSRRVLDFGDLEHRTLDLLLGVNRSGPTAAAGEIAQRFREIMVDEYQDSNAVQDAIFEALTRKKNNCFMVGDVKQSIYRFRLADPGIFLEKYRHYLPAEEAAPGQGRKVLLSANFRSGGGVLSGVNDIFRLCMSPEVGGLYYGEEEALREGVGHVPLGEKEVTLLALDVRENTYLEEAALVADRVQALLDGTHFVRQGESLRPIAAEDIAILLRSPGSVGAYYRNALRERGILCVSGGGEDLLETEQIAVLRALLQVIGNPRQDIPLIAVLASPLFCFGAEDLAKLRSHDRRCSIYDALLASKSEKAVRFLKVLEMLRWEARRSRLPLLLEKILTVTNFEEIYAAMPGGEARVTDIQSFYALAVEFDAPGQRDLSQFLEFLDSMQERGLVAAGEQGSTGAVTLMSIHRSKGLEYPVVFVCGLSRGFNQESIKAQVLCDKTLGLGLSAVDEKNRVRFPTLAKRAIAVKTMADSLSEELRILYVALTRARDRLIMTYASDSLEKDVQELALRSQVPELLTRDVVCPGQWVLLAALHRTEAGALFALGTGSEERKVSSVPWDIQVVTVPKMQQAQALPDAQSALSEEVIQQIKQGLAFRYAHGAATTAPSKQTATQRKGREKDAEAAEHAAPRKPAQRIWRKPSFAEKTGDTAAYGNAMHTCLQYLRYENCGGTAAIAGEVQRLAREGCLTPEQAQLIDCGALAAFFASELGQKLRNGTQVLREFKFSILDDGEHYDPALSGEKILLQGVVDCALIEDDGITVIDFKTDFVTEATLQDKVCHYRPQVLAYAGALQRIYGKMIKAALLYFFRLNRFVPISQEEME